jgi:hypothetical protein
LGYPNFENLETPLETSMVFDDFGWWIHGFPKITWKIIPMMDEPSIFTKPKVTHFCVASYGESAEIPGTCRYHRHIDTSTRTAHLSTHLESRSRDVTSFQRRIVMELDYWRPISQHIWILIFPHYSTVLWAEITSPDHSTSFFLQAREISKHL